MIKEISSSEFDQIVADKKLTVIKFGAPWCGTCQAIAPALEAIANENSHVNFVEIDADKNTDFVVGMGVRSLPTFAFYKQGELLSVEKGLDGGGILKRIQQHG